MGYEVAKSYSVNAREFEVKGVFASSNVYPQTFYPGGYVMDERKYMNYEAYQKGLLTFRDIFKIEELASILGGSIQFNKSVYIKYRYALHQTEKKLSVSPTRFRFWDTSRLMRDKKNTSFGQSVPDDATYREMMKELKSYSDFYYDFIENPTNVKGRYIVEIGSNYLVKELKRGYKYSWDRGMAKIYNNLWEAEMASDNVKGNVVVI